MLKTTALLLCVVAAAFGLPVQTEEQLTSLWSSYKQTYNKVYGVAEEEERFKLFKERVAIVNEHNERFHKGMVTYYLEVNHNADLTIMEMMHRNGYRQDASNKVERTRLVSVSAQAEPNSVDWRTKGLVTEVKDQGQCGSCWSFGTTGVLEGQWAKHHGKLVSMSEQMLVDCDTDWDSGCNGGLATHAYGYIKKNGIDSEASYPYTARQGTCKYNPDNVVANLTGYVSLPEGDEAQLKTATANIGPISVGIDASHLSFQLYGGGVYNEPQCSSSRLDHAVLVVGYGTDNGKDYWLVKNSWGLGWGEKGYIKMSRNADNQCGIATDASYPNV